MDGKKYAYNLAVLSVDFIDKQVKSIGEVKTIHSSPTPNQKYVFMEGIVNLYYNKQYYLKYKLKNN